MAIKLKLDGFDELLREIEAAGKSADTAAESAVKAGAQAMQSELQSALQAASESGLASRLPAPQIEKRGGAIVARVGFDRTPYDPKRPSDYFKAVFLNYGTPYRTKHGKEGARGFVTKAKRRARPKIQKAQKDALQKILQRLKK